MSRYARFPISSHRRWLVVLGATLALGASVEAQNGRYVYAGGIFTNDPLTNQGGRIYSVDTETGGATLVTTSTLVTGTINALASNHDDGLAYYGSGTTLYGWNRDTDSHFVVAELSGLGVQGFLQSGGGTYWDGSYYVATETALNGVSEGGGRSIDIWRVDFTPESGGTAVQAATRMNVAAAGGFDGLGDFGDVVAFGNVLYGSTVDRSASYSGDAAGESAAGGYWSYELGAGVFAAIGASLSGRQLAIDGDGNVFATNGASNEAGGSQLVAIDIATGAVTGTPMNLGFAPADLTGPWDTDSQVRFGTVNGLVENGGSDTVNLGSVFIGGSFTPTTITAIKNGSQSTTYTLTTGGNASLSSTPSQSFGSGTSVPAQDIGATLTGTNVLGQLSGNVTNDNQDPYSIDPTETVANNQYGVIDPNDTVNLVGAVYGHSNASFSTTADQNTGAPLDLGEFTDAAAPMPEGARAIHNLPGTDVPGGNSTPDNSPNAIAYTVDLGYTPGLGGPDAGAFTLPGGGGTLAANATTEVGVAFNPGAPSVNRLGTYSATVEITPEDTNLNAVGFTGPNAAPNTNDATPLDYAVTATVRDSQVTFANLTDTSDGGASALTGQLANGTAHSHEFGNVWRGQALSATADVHLTGNENTGYSVTQTAGGATLGGDLSALHGSLAGNDADPSAISNPGRISAILGTTETGAVASTLLLANTDTRSPNATIQALDLGNGTGAGMGAGDSDDTLTLSAAVYGHSNATFVDPEGSRIPTGNTAGDFDPANDDIDTWSLDFGTWDSDGNYLGGGNTGGAANTFFAIGNLPVVDSEDGSDNGLVYTVQLALSSVSNDSPLLDGAAFGLGDTGVIDGLNADAVARLIAASWNPSGLAAGSYSITYTITLEDDRGFDPGSPGANADDLGLGIDPSDLTGGGEALELTLGGTVVPESSAGLLGLAACILLAGRRRRSRNRE